MFKFSVYWFYYFCEKYDGCELNYYMGMQFSQLCEIYNYSQNFEKHFEKIEDNKVKLVKFAFELFEMLEECICIDIRSFEAFSGKYSFLFRDDYTGQKDSVSLKNYLKYKDNNF